MRRGTLLGGIATLVPILAHADELSDWRVSGAVDLRYRARTDGDDTDQDIRELLTLSVSEARRRLLSGHLSLLMIQDLDGGGDSFISLADTHGRNYFQLNSAYIDYQPRWRLLDRARVGRQWLEGVPDVVRFDGGRIETGALERRLRTRLVLYGGVPWHVGESSRRHDHVLGGGIVLSPWSATRASAYYTRLRDVYRSHWVKDSESVSVRDDLLSLDVRQSLLDHRIQLAGGYTNLDGRSRDARARVSFGSLDGRWGLAVSYRALFATQRRHARELDPYHATLRSYHPHHQANLDVNGSPSEHLHAFAGASIRRLGTRRDRGPFNHEFERYYLGMTIEAFPLSGSELSIVGNIYDADSDHFWVVEGSLKQEITERLSAEAGTGYALYGEKRYSDDERNHVRTTFVRFGYETTFGIEIKGGYTVEVDDEDTVHVFDIKILCRF